MNHNFLRIGIALQTVVILLLVLTINHTGKGGIKGGFTAYIPNTKAALPLPLRSGEQDITFRVSKADAEKVRGLAMRRGVVVRVGVE